MKQLMDCSIALSAWQEISPEEAATIYRHGVPILLYHEHIWKHALGAAQSWRSHRNMRAFISDSWPCQQAFLQQLPGSKQMRLDRANGQGEDLGHLFIRPVLKMAQDQDETILYR